LYVLEQNHDRDAAPVEERGLAIVFVSGATGPPGTAGTVAASVAASESLSSNGSSAYGALTTPGPSVTVTVPASGRVLVGVTSAMTGNAAATSCLMSYAITGATTAAASDANAVILAGSAVQRASATSVLSLTAGSTTFTAQYRTQGRAT
jgi:hypothetical protein